MVVVDYALLLSLLALEESLGEMYRKDDIDVSNHEHTAPVYFQPLSLD